MDPSKHQAYLALEPFFLVFIDEIYPYVAMFVYIGLPIIEVSASGGNCTPDILGRSQPFYLLNYRGLGP